MTCINWLNVLGQWPSMLLFLLLHNTLEQYLNKKLNCLTEGGPGPLLTCGHFYKVKQVPM